MIEVYVGDRALEAGALAGTLLSAGVIIQANGAYLEWGPAGDVHPEDEARIRAYGPELYRLFSRPVVSIVVPACAFWCEPWSPFPTERRA